MLSSNTRPSQFDFSFLSVPDLQPVVCSLDAMDHDAVSRSGSSDSAKSATPVQEAYVPVSYICPEAYALLAAAEASAARRADDMDAKGTTITVLDGAHGLGSTLQSAMDGWHGPGSVLLKMAPPKRFYRTFWQSVSQRLLHR